jgi:hypothetical protein
MSNRTKRVKSFIFYVQCLLFRYKHYADTTGKTFSRHTGLFSQFIIYISHTHINIWIWNSLHWLRIDHPSVPFCTLALNVALRPSNLALNDGPCEKVLLKQIWELSVCWPTLPEIQRFISFINLWNIQCGWVWVISLWHLTMLLQIRAIFIDMIIFSILQSFIHQTVMAEMWNNNISKEK